ncbi:MAG: caspase family protein [Pseudomonadales bacterium]
MTTSAIALGLTFLLVAPLADAANKRAINKYRKQLLADRAVEGMTRTADLFVVDCLLPGKVRRLGNSTYLSPRRPVKATASDCRLKGGEYTDYDRADYRSALNVWMPSAEQGDAEAQTHVGEIFERGLGGDPNYEAARLWYERAAQQGNTRAQFALGTLYEQGLGVPKSQLQALNWYRQAWGIDQDSVMFSSAARRQREAEAEHLQSQIAEKDQQIEALRTQLLELREDLTEAGDAGEQAQARLITLQSIVADLEQQSATQRTKLSALLAQVATERPVTADRARKDLRLREPSIVVGDQDAGSAVQGVPNARSINYRDLSLGRYYALLIGNAEYEQMEDLQTPINDVARARDLLQDKYGFTVFTLDNGNSIEMMQAINNLADVLTENDNLLLFFAGHGTRLQNGESEAGYWLPKNAERPPRNTYWVSNEFVSGHLARLPAKRVLVVADSCYAGLLAGEPSLALMGVDAPQYSNPEFLEFKLSKRARLLLSSGGDRPVLDQGADGHSVFANAFLSELENNEGLLTSPQLYLNIRERIKHNAETFGFEQQPELRTIKSAGHEVGDFFFVTQAD